MNARVVNAASFFKFHFTLIQKLQNITEILTREVEVEVEAMLNRAKEGAARCQRARNDGNMQCLRDGGLASS